MTKRIYISDLFNPRPWQWGFRGDPYLWDEMKHSFDGIPLPTSKSELEAELAAAYEKLTGYPIERTEHFRVERYPQSGMSGGGISPSFWQETGFPLLLSRFESA